MTLKPGYYSENFAASEFDNVEPESILLTVLERLRVKTGDSIVITSGPRVPKKHIEVYKNLDKKGKLGDKKWHDAIPWGSRHLPAFGKKLQAADIKAVESRVGSGPIYYSGDDLYKFLKEIEEEIGVYLGIGVGKDYCHVDIDRKRPTVWYYSY